MRRVEASYLYASERECSEMEGRRPSSSGDSTRIDRSVEISNERSCVRARSMRRRCIPSLCTPADDLTTVLALLPLQTLVVAPSVALPLLRRIANSESDDEVEKI